LSHLSSNAPYIAKEVVFDEHEIAAYHLMEKEAIKAAIHERETSGQCYATAANVRSPISAPTLLALGTKKIIDHSPCRAVTAHQGICFCRKRVTSGLTETQR
jgi:hypothetical protein